MLKKLFTPKKTDIAWMIGLIPLSLLFSTLYYFSVYSMPFAESFSAVMGGTAFMIMSFSFINEMIFPILFLLLEFFSIRCADSFIEDKKIRIPVLIIAVSLLFHFFLERYI